MAKFNVPYTCPTRFDLERFACNGQVPSPLALRRLADGFNHVICIQKRQVFMYSCNLTSLSTPSSAASILWPVAFRTGRGTTGLVIYVGLVKSDFGAVTTPSMTFLVSPLGGGGSVSADVYFNQRASAATIVPDEINHQHTVLEGLSPNTEYKMEIQAVNGARPVYIGIWERQHAGVGVVVEGMPAVLTVDDSDDDICNPGQFADDKDILDSGISKLVTASNNLLKHSRTHLLSFAATPYEATAASGTPVTGSTTYLDIANRTFHIDTSVLKTARRSGSTAVPIRLAVRSDRTVGTGTLSVGLYDIDAAAIVAEITGIADDGSTGWSVVTEDLPAQDGRYQLHAKQSNTTTTHVIYGVSMWPWEA